MNSVPQQAKRNEEIKQNKLFYARKGNNRSRNGGFLEEEFYETHFFRERLISGQYNYNKRERWRQQTCDQLKRTLPIHSFSTFQNGEPTVVEKPHTKNECMCKLNLRDAYLCAPLS